MTQNNVRSITLVFSEFLIHILVGTVIFLVLAGFSFSIIYVGEQVKLSGTLVSIAKFVEVLLLTLDVLLYVIYVLRSFIDLGRSLFSLWEQDNV